MNISKLSSSRNKSNVARRSVPMHNESEVIHLNKTKTTEQSTKPPAKNRVSFAGVEPSVQVTPGKPVSKENKKKKTKYVGKQLMCQACGNMEKYCHQVMFGFFLTHECITMYEDSVEPENVTENMLHKHFVDKYNDRLRIYCWDEFHKYDTCWYELPMCHESGSLQYTLKLIQNQQVYCLLRNKRIYGVAQNHIFHAADKMQKKRKK